MQNWLVLAKWPELISSSAKSSRCSSSSEAGDWLPAGTSVLCKSLCVSRCSQLSLFSRALACAALVAQILSHCLRMQPCDLGNCILVCRADVPTLDAMNIALCWLQRHGRGYFIAGAQQYGTLVILSKHLSLLLHVQV